MGLRSPSRKADMHPRFLSLLCSPLLLAAALLTATCSDDAISTCAEGSTEPDGHGPRCCSGGCGTSTDGWLPRVCKKASYVCEKGTIEDACAYVATACSPMIACGQKVKLDGDEPDPAPELCCTPDCSGTEVVHRTCQDGVRFTCPGNSVTISTCKDYKAACGGALQKYRDNDFKL
jgi:hypothetical protein